ncbi:MAG: sugar ABC transporter ATP-binding protein [Tabrizicola sp.]|nr:sugar ABC transporter ATP-binding protein [Tabrizicola sp.]
MAAETAPVMALQEALRFSGIRKVFGGVKALDDVDFAVGAGEVHCLAGENGSGKSTLIKIITGVYQPEPGAGMQIFGQTYGHISPTLARKAGIAVIWQDLALFAEMTVAENIAFETLLGNRPRAVSYTRLRKVAQDALARLSDDVHTLSAKVDQLSRKQLNELL